METRICKALALLLLAFTLRLLALPGIHAISIQADSVPNRKERIGYIMLQFIFMNDAGAIANALKLFGFKRQVQL